MEIAEIYNRRYLKLKGRSVSVEEAENVELIYENAKYRLAESKEKLSFFQYYNKSGTIYAPFDCIVTKVFVVSNSGTEAGMPILEIVPAILTNGAVP